MLAGGPSKRGKNKGRTSSDFTFFPTKQVELWKPDFFIAELGKLVMMADSVKDHDTSLARAVMLPNDIANLAMEGLEEICDLLNMQQVQVMDVSARVVCLKIFSFIYK